MTTASKHTANRCGKMFGYESPRRRRRRRAIPTNPKMPEPSNASVPGSGVGVYGPPGAEVCTVVATWPMADESCDMTAARSPEGFGKLAGVRLSTFSLAAPMAVPNPSATTTANPNVPNQDLHISDVLH
jgi:hypothetical protein